MPNLKLQNFMVWRKSQQKNLWISWISSNPDLEKDDFGWWDLEIFSADAGSQFISMEFKK